LATSTCFLSAVFFLCAADDVSVVTGSLSTAGGAVVDITGRNLGLEAAAVSMSYSGGSTGLASRTYAPTEPCVVVSVGTHVRCPSAPGVGANYSVVMTVSGGSSAPSVRLVSYSQPAITSVDGPGATLAPAAGGVPIFLHGSNFGPANSTTALRVWAVPTANESLSFPGVSCTVTEAHVTVACLTSPNVGAAFTWRVQVEGLVNTMPQSTAAAPVVTLARFVGRDVRVANTQGGTVLALDGINFGHFVDHIRVTVTVPAGLLEASPCTMPALDTQVQCVLPAGTGPITRVGITILGQFAQLDVTGLAYAPPTLSAVTPGTWSTDLTSMTVLVRGSGFGSPAQSGLVAVTASGDTGCAGVGSVTVAGSTVTVVNDTELSFVARAAPAHLVRQWSLAVSVAGQGLAVDDVLSRAAAVVRTRSPGPPAVTLATASNGTHQFLLLTGTDYGPALSACPDDLMVTVGGQPCAALSMLLVRALLVVSWWCRAVILW
jgi:hypothetical protein